MLLYSSLTPLETTAARDIYGTYHLKPPKEILERMLNRLNRWRLVGLDDPADFIYWQIIINLLRISVD